MYCAETRQLSHSFSSHADALKSVNLQVPGGSIYGFLGPNGAGKTTTLRLLLGLLKIKEGEVLLFNKPLRKQRLQSLAKIGSMIESPSIYSHLTATENLAIYRELYQCSGQRIGEVLSLVGLSETGKKKAGQFSLGMKQRLGLAIALLHQPALLVLDEPTNGLDPNGIIEIRDLLKKLNEEQGISIIISSHLLSEIEKLVTHVGIISKGKMVFQGTLNELTGKQQQSSKLILETDDPGRSLEICRQLELNVISGNGKITLPVPSREKIAALNRELVNSNISVFEMSVIKKDLETIFMELINQ
ncbi:MAG: ABC transporter ATP-binding protein [Bacteroidetes bacterium]|nr:ABC transporter ATP-binding protein [Bacteroidota bacterium]